jgi:sugar transferase EpsL
MVLKRSIDFGLALLGLVLLLPVFGIVAIGIAVTMGRPVLFRQRRPGRNSEIFNILKFRTMTTEQDTAGNLLPDADRLTGVGKLLRSTSLDELPQLWHVLTGEMSLVGPRPLLPQYLDRYSPEQKRRHEVRPGITGLAQVKGRNGVTWEERLRLDVWYVDNWSFWLDLKIVFLTAWTVIRRDGISQEGEATMTEFMGSRHSEVA